jgi:hypothetical protein
MEGTQNQSNSINHCPNCQSEMKENDSYCHYCGQKWEKSKISLKHLLYDLFSSMFNIDNRILKTLLFMWVPGKLTHLFFEGKRKRFSHPLKFYLFLSFVLFGLIGYRLNNMLNISQINDSLDSKAKLRKVEMMKDLDTLVQNIERNANNQDYKNGAEALFYLFSTDSTFTPPSDTIMADIGHLAIMADQDSFQWKTDYDTVFYNYTNQTEQFTDLGIMAREIYEKKIEPDSFELKPAILDRMLKFDQKIAMTDLLDLKPMELNEKYKINGFFTRLYINQAAKIIKNPGNAIYYALSGFSWVAIMFIPFMALMLKLLYLRRKFYYVEHLVFLVHTTSMLFLLIILIMALEFLLGKETFYLLLLPYPVYLLYAFKRFYRQNWFKTITKWVIGQSLGILSIIIFFLLSALLRMIIF